MSQSGEGQATARDQARWDLATKLIFGALLLLLSAAISWATYSAREVGAKVERASEQLVKVTEAQKGMVRMVGALEQAVTELKRIVDEVRLEQASRAGLVQRLERLEAELEAARVRLRDLERRVGVLEGRK